MRDWYSLEKFSADYMRARLAEAARDRLAKEATRRVSPDRRSQQNAEHTAASVLQRLLHRFGRHTRARIAAWACERALGRFEARVRRLPSRHSA